MQALLDPRLNLWASCISGLSALVLFSRCRSKFSESSAPYMTPVLVLWIVQWIATVLLYITLGIDFYYSSNAASRPFIRHIVLALSSLGTLSVLWVALVLFRGTARHVASEIGFVSLVFLTWDFSFATTSSFLFKLPSLIAIICSFALAPAGFYRRFGWHSTWYVLNRLFGLVLQYFTFLRYFRDESEPPPLNTLQYSLLALNKILSAFLFYWLVSSSDVAEHRFWADFKVLWRNLNSRQYRATAGMILLMLMLLLVSSPWLVFFNPSIMAHFKLASKDSLFLSVTADNALFAVFAVVIPLLREFWRPPDGPPGRGTAAGAR